MNISNPGTNFLKRVRHGAREDPARDWLALVTVSLIAFVGIIVWNVWAFDTVARGGAIGTSAKVASSDSARITLDAIRAIFESRAAEQAKYSTGVYRYADPSQ
jgi:hypothetical protein